MKIKLEKYNRKSQWLLLPVVCFAAMIPVGCNTGHKRVQLPPEYDSLPAPVRYLAETVANDDSVGFASAVSYPLERPYPLRSIRDSAEMVKYYPKMVDDSLKQAITKSAGRWRDYGWRGWSIDDGSLLWIDEKLYEVQYMSREELKEHERLVADEMASLSPEMRGDWVPERCLRDTVTGTVYRLDVGKVPPHIRRQIKESIDDTMEENPNLEQTVIYRLAKYKRHGNLHGRPDGVVTGSLQTDGSMASPLYIFENENGDRVELDPYPSDGDLPQMRISSLPDSVITLTPVYWRDLLQ